MTPAAQTTILPLDMPIDMFWLAEKAACLDGKTLTRYVRDCIATDLERFVGEQELKTRRANDRETLKRLSKSKKITIIQQEDQP